MLKRKAFWLYLTKKKSEVLVSPITGAIKATPAWCMFILNGGVNTVLAEDRQ